MQAFSIAGIVKCLKGVQDFNEAFGNLEGEITKDKLLAQARICVEEAGEALQAIEGDEPQKDILKEAVDLLVVAHGLALLLAKAGYDVEGAWKEVNANNMTKFCTTLTDATYSKIGYDATNEPVEIIVRNGVLALIDENMKLRKPIGYKKVDLSKYTPKQEGEK